MIAWLTENIGTVAVCAVLLVIVVLVIRKLVRDRKNGSLTCSCGGDCGKCGHCIK